MFTRFRSLIFGYVRFVNSAIYSAFVAIAVATVLSLAASSHAQTRSTTLLGAKVDLIRADAEKLRAQAETDACGKKTCPVCSCEGRSQTLQALIETEAILAAIHTALIEKEGDLRRRYFNVAAGSRLTGVQMEQLRRSLAYQQFLHKLGSSLLRVASILNFFEKFTSDYQGLRDIDDLANFAKNLDELQRDFESFKNHGDSPELVDARQKFNKAWDWKSDFVDLAKAIKAIRDAIKPGSSPQTFDLKNFRNLWSGLARVYKQISAAKLEAEKEVLEHPDYGLKAIAAAEGKSMTAAFNDWQNARNEMLAAEATLIELRAAAAATGASMARAECGSSSISRPQLGPFGSYGAALRTLQPMLNKAGKALTNSIKTKDNCPDSDAGTNGTPTPRPPRNVVKNDCPQCRGIALELGRTLDQREFVASEILRINRDVEKAEEMEKQAQKLESSIQVLTERLRLLRNPRSGSSPATAVDIADLEGQRDRLQAELRIMEEKIRALKLEESRLRDLNKENLRLYELAEKLKLNLQGCQATCKTGNERCERPLSERGAIACIEALILKLQAAYDARITELGERPYFTACKTRIRSIFAEAGVEGEWSSVCNSWDAASKFYWQHRSYLVDSKMRIENSHQFTDEDIKYLEDGFASWSRVEAEFGRLVTERWTHLRISAGYEKSWQDAVKRTRASRGDEERQAAERLEKSAYDTNGAYYAVIQSDNKAIRDFGERTIFTSLPRSR